MISCYRNKTMRKFKETEELQLEQPKNIKETQQNPVDRNEWHNFRSQKHKN